MDIGQRKDLVVTRIMKGRMARRKYRIRHVVPSLVRESMIDASYSNCLLVMIWTPGRPHSKPASHVGDPARGAAGLSEEEWEWAGSA